MSFIQVVLLGMVQGFAELLPVSSSAHVVVAEKLMRLDPTAPEHTFLLVMLHLGTMLAVLVYFRKRWANRLRGPHARLFLSSVIIATIATGAVGLALKHVLENVILPRVLGADLTEVEQLFGSVTLISTALAAAGLLIVLAGRFERRAQRSSLSNSVSLTVGVVQGLCLPFRGFSRSGATISTALLARIDRALAEDFSFALAVLLTPPVIYLELRRYMKAAGTFAGVHFGPAMLGMMASLLAGLVALRWLSSWLERGRWASFGYYCLVASAALLVMQASGFV